MRELKSVIGELIRLRRQGVPILTSPKVLWRYYRFFENRGIPNCRAGIRCLVINPDGSLFPCAMLYDKKYSTQRELIRRFSRHNTCTGCYVSTRANTEKSLGEFFIDSLTTYQHIRRDRCSVFI